METCNGWRHVTGGDTIKRGVRSGGTVSAEGGREMARSEKVSEGHGGEMWGDGVPVEARRDDHIVERESRPSPPPSCVDLGRREAGWGESECAAKARGVLQEAAATCHPGKRCPSEAATRAVQAVCLRAASRPLPASFRTRTSRRSNEARWRGEGRPVHECAMPCGTRMSAATARAGRS